MSSTLLMLIMRELEVEVLVPLKHLDNFWRSLDMPLINCEIALLLSWYKECVLVNKATTAGGDAAGDQPTIVDIDTPTEAEFEITDCKLYVPVVTVKSVHENKLLNQLKTGFKKTIEWNKYRSQMSTQPVNKNLNYLIDPTFTKIHRLFVLAFENEDDRPCYFKYCTPTVEIKHYNVLINRKPFFEIPVKNMEETYEKIIDLGNDDYYITGSLLNYQYFKKYYKLIAIDLSRQIELEDEGIMQQIDFIGTLKRAAINNVYPQTTMFFIVEKKEKTVIDISQNSATIIN